MYQPNFSIKTIGSTTIILSDPNRNRIEFPYTNLRDGSNNSFGSLAAALTYLKSILASPSDYRHEVALGHRANKTTWNKFGYNLDVDSAAEEVIASFGGTFAVMTTADTLDVVSSDADDVDTTGTGARQILIVGIGSDGLSQQEVVALNGTTPVTTSNTWLGVNRAYVISSGSSNSNEGAITIDDTSNTVGNQAQIPAGESVTQQAIFHTQTGFTFLVDWLFANIRRITGNNNDVRYTIKGFSYSRITETVYEIFRFDGSTRTDGQLPLPLPQPFVIGGQEVLYFTLTTDTNNTVVNFRFSGIEQNNN